MLKLFLQSHHKIDKGKLIYSIKNGNPIKYIKIGLP